MKIYSGSPEQVILERRDDGFYNMTMKVYSINPDDKTKTKIVYEKYVVELPTYFTQLSSQKI